MTSNQTNIDQKVNSICSYSKIYKKKNNRDSLHGHTNQRKSRKSLHLASKRTPQHLQDSQNHLPPQAPQPQGGLESPTRSLPCKTGKVCGSVCVCVCVSWWDAPANTHTHTPIRNPSHTQTAAVTGGREDLTVYRSAHSEEVSKRSMTPHGKQHTTLCDDVSWSLTVITKPHRNPPLLIRHFTICLVNVNFNGRRRRTGSKRTVRIIISNKV